MTSQDVFASWRFAMVSYGSFVIFGKYRNYYDTPIFIPNSTTC